MDWIIFALAAFILFTFLGYNRLIRLRSNVYKTFSVLDKQLENRNNLLHDLVLYFQKTINNKNSKVEELVLLCKKDKNVDLSIDQRVKLNNRINLLLSELLDVACKHPDVVNKSEFSQLKTQLSDIEKKLKKSAVSYNEAIGFYNNAIYMFPSNVFALLFGFKSLMRFEI